jgi:hypothetical protein
MEKPIKYKRFSGTYNKESIQTFFNELIIEGWEIINYHEIIQPMGILTATPNEILIHVTILGCKRQSNVL